MGSVLPSDVDWNRVNAVLQKARSESDTPEASERRVHVFNRFQSIRAPRAFASYVVKSCVDAL